jgi:hypothetical protein
MQHLRYRCELVRGSKALSRFTAPPILPANQADFPAFLTLNPRTNPTSTAPIASSANGTQIGANTQPQCQVMIPASLNPISIRVSQPINPIRPLSFTADCLKDLGSCFLANVAWEVENSLTSVITPPRAVVLHECCRIQSLGPSFCHDRFCRAFGGCLAHCHRYLR